MGAGRNVRFRNVLAVVENGVFDHEFLHDRRRAGVEGAQGKRNLVVAEGAVVIPVARDGELVGRARVLEIEGHVVLARGVGIIDDRGGEVVNTALVLRVERPHQQQHRQKG